LLHDAGPYCKKSVVDLRMCWRDLVFVPWCCCKAPHAVLQDRLSKHAFCSCLGLFPNVLLLTSLLATHGSEEAMKVRREERDLQREG